ncbi:hypothetical protein RhiirA5_355151, partial [Rhizophagus irregularis]
MSNNIDELRIATGAAIAGMVAVCGATEWNQWYLIIIDKKEKKEQSIKDIRRIVTSSDDGKRYVTEEVNNKHITTSTEGKYITKFTSGGEDIIEYITTLTGGVITKTTINGEEYEFITSERVKSQPEPELELKPESEFEPEPESEPESEPEQPELEREYITKSEKSKYIINTINPQEHGR